MPIYYQLGGFQPQIQWFSGGYDDKKLAEVIAGLSSPLRSQNTSMPLELILGIKRIGTSHLLLTDEQTRSIAHQMSLPLPKRSVPPSAFESLSPIYFNDPAGLEKKLSVLKSKSQKGRSVIRDSSQANRQYTSGEDGIHRSAFEHGRVLYHLLHRNIEPRKFGLEDLTERLNGLRVCSIAFNTKGVDHRPLADRVNYPSVLDIGWAEADLPGFTVKSGSTNHRILHENQFLSQGSPKLSFSFGDTKTLHAYKISPELHNFFVNSKEYNKPVILLVHRELVTRNVLKNILKMDIPEWKSGIKDLLGFPTPSGPSSIPHRSYEVPRTHPRSRSRSPPRRNMYQGEPAPNFPRRPSPPPATSRASDFPPIYVLDIELLYVKLMQSNHQSQSVANIARQLNLLDETGWCAGNEACLMIEIWRTMISGAAIDEQRVQRMGKLAIPDDSQPTEPTTADDSDDDVDPNDIVVPPPVEALKARQAYELDSESDYGDSD